MSLLKKIKRRILIDNLLKEIQVQLESTSPIQKRILSVQEQNKFELVEFMRFVLKVLSGSLLSVKVKENYGIQDLMRNDPLYPFFQEILSATIDNVGHFYKTYIIGQRAIIDRLDNHNQVSKSRWLLKLFVMNNNFQTGIMDSLSSNQSYTVDEIDPVNDEELGIEIDGWKIYHDYLQLLFWSEQKKGEDSKPFIFEYGRFDLDYELYDDDSEFFSSIDTFQTNLIDICNSLQITTLISLINSDL